MRKRIYLFLSLYSFIITCYAQEDLDSMYHKNQIGLGVCTLNPFGYYIPSIANSSTIFGGNYHGGLGLELSYYRRVSRKMQIGGIITFLDMSPLKGGSLDSLGESSFYTKLDFSARYLLSERIIKPYFSGDIGYGLLYYKNDNGVKINDNNIRNNLCTNILSIAPGIGLMISFSKNIHIDFSYSYNVVLPLNNYRPVWLTGRVLFGIAYSFNSKKRK